jgi:chromosomal replication initiation ATPase DnaA
MQENKEVESLLTNIQKGLQMYSIRELNTAIKGIIDNSGETKKDTIKYTLHIVCMNFNISMSDLMNKNNRGTIVDAKQIAYCLLYFQLNLSVKYISTSVFKSWRNSIYRGINRLKNINPNIKDDDNFLKKYNTIKETIELYIKNNNTI